MNRQRRGRESERALASYLRAHGWPYAEPCGAYAPGPDVTGTPGVSIEVKSRTRLDLLAWLKEAATRRGVPVLVVRSNGQGTTDPGSWAAVLSVADLTVLLRAAGYGDPLPDLVAAGVRDD